ncbi:MAG: hypothetical protein RR949_03375, partial [Oscillospiraceae bacterium]
MATKMKKTLSLALALIMVLGMLPLSAMAEEAAPVVDPIPQTEEAEQQTPPTQPVGPDTLASDRKISKRNIELWIKWENGQWLQGTDVSIEVFDEAGQKIGNTIEETTGKYGSSKGVVSFKIPPTPEPKSVKVTYETADEKYAATGDLDIDANINARLTLEKLTSDQKLLDKLGSDKTVSFNVYRYYDNVVPVEIHDGFYAVDFGPKGDDSPYFTVTVNMAE